jgi:hypothetical protein
LEESLLSKVAQHYQAKASQEIFHQKSRIHEGKYI